MSSNKHTERVIKELKLIFKCKRHNMRDVSGTGVPFSVHKIIKEFKKHYKQEANKKLTPSQRIFNVFPKFRQIEGFADFIDTQDHIRFEKADLKNDVEDFVRMICEGKLNCMMVHMKNTCFDWRNWKVFCVRSGLHKVIRNKEDYQTKFDVNDIDAWCMETFDDYF